MVIVQRRLVIENWSRRPPLEIGRVELLSNGQVTTAAATEQLHRHLMNRVLRGHGPDVITPDEGVTYFESVLREFRGSYVRAREVDAVRALGGPGSGNFGHAGRPGEVGGSASEGGARTEQQKRDTHRFYELKNRQARINNELFDYVDRPDHPEAQAKLNELKSIVKEIYTLDADPGGLEGIGLPGGPRDVVIVGAGPGGMQAAIMGGTDGLDTLLIESSDRPGGQARGSSRIENFAGFPVGVTGDQLATRMYEQTQRVGAESRLNTRVVDITHNEETGLKTVTLSTGETIETRSVILAGGIESTRVNFPGADNPNVYYSESFTDRVREQGAGYNVVVAGGSNGAAQAALIAAKTANHVTVISRSPIVSSMSDYQVEALRARPNITVVEGDQIQSFSGTTLRTQGDRAIDCQMMGIYFGGEPKTDWLPSQIARVPKPTPGEKRNPDAGKIKVNANLETSMPGVFAIGDMRTGSIGRIGAAVGDGQYAAKHVWSYFEQLKQSAAAKKPRAAAEFTEKKRRIIPIQEFNDLVDTLFEVDKKYPYIGQSYEFDQDKPTPPEELA